MLKNLGYEELYISFAETEELIQEVVIESNE
jgi:hypothetical protein